MLDSVIATIIWAGCACCASATVPLPPERPVELGRVAPEPPRRPVPSPAPTSGSERPRPEQVADPDGLDQLVAMGVEAEPMEPIADGQCVIAAPLKLTMLPDGLRVDPPAVLTCPAIKALARWTLDSISGAAQRELA